MRFMRASKRVVDGDESVRAQLRGELVAHARRCVRIGEQHRAECNVVRTARATGISFGD